MSAASGRGHIRRRWVIGAVSGGLALSRGDDGDPVRGAPVGGSRHRVLLVIALLLLLPLLLYVVVAIFDRLQSHFGFGLDEASAIIELRSPRRRGRARLRSPQPARSRCSAASRSRDRMQICSGPGSACPPTVGDCGPVGDFRPVRRTCSRPHHFRTRWLPHWRGFLVFRLSACIARAFSTTAIAAYGSWRRRRPPGTRFLRVNWSQAILRSQPRGFEWGAGPWSHKPSLTRIIYISDSASRCPLRTQGRSASLR